MFASTLDELMGMEQRRDQIRAAQQTVRRQREKREVGRLSVTASPLGKITVTLATWFKRRTQTPASMQPAACC